jgi:uncharacterized protein
MRLSKKKIELIAQYFEDKPVIRAYLFGSYARGEADRKSDVDLLVEVDYSKKIGFAFFGWHLDLEELLHKKVDVVLADGLSPYIKPYIESEKLLIYEKRIWQHSAA